MKQIIIEGQDPESIQIAVLENDKLVDLETPRSKKAIKGNIYLAKVMRVEPSLQAAFVDYGEEKFGFVPFAEIHSGYYNVPKKYRQDAEEHEVDDKHEDDIAEGHEDEVIDEGEDDIAEPEGSQANAPEEEDDDDDIETVKQRNVERYRIQEVIKRNQILLVQATKEERGNKGASFTTYISLAGRYCVIMPAGNSKGGVSRKITDSAERRRLQAIVQEIHEANPIGFIIRTVGQGQDESRIRKDYNYLSKLWNGIRETTLASSAPAFIHAEDDILKTAICEMYDDDCKEVIVQGEETYNKLMQVVEMMSVEDEINISMYKEPGSIFAAYNIDSEISELYNPVVHLPSGGYLVIEHTEALVSIDVNSGKSITERNIEETALKTNVEAAREVARQMRLRNLSGLIVIDFIDMVVFRNKKQVERTMRDLLFKDRAKAHMSYISQLGLMEISRQRLKPTFIEANTKPCSACSGHGFIRSEESTVSRVLKIIESELLSNKYIVCLNAFTTVSLAMSILNTKRHELQNLETRFAASIVIQNDPKITNEGIAIEVVEDKYKKFSRAPRDTQVSKPADQEAPVDVHTPEASHTAAKGRSNRRPRSRSRSTSSSSSSSDDSGGAKLLESV